MTTRASLAPLALFLQLLAGPALAAVNFDQDTSQTYVLLVATSPEAERGIDQVQDTLDEYYGVRRSNVKRLVGPEATTAQIEEWLYRGTKELRDRDTFFVVLALKVHAKGEDRVLETFGYDSSKPWTGLSTGIIEKVASYSPTGSIWVFVPECAPQELERKYEQNTLGRSHSRGGRVVVGFCEPQQSPLGSSIGRSLAQALRSAAEDGAITRGPWMSASERGFITSDQVLVRLSETARDMRLRTLSTTGGGATLYVAAPLPQRAATELRTALRDARTIDKFTAVLASAVTQAREAADSGVRTDIASELRDFALDRSREPTWRVLCVQALGDLERGVAVPALARVYREASGTDEPQVVVRHAALIEWSDDAVKRNDLTLVREALADTDPNVRAAAIDTAAAAKDVSALPVVEQAIRSDQAVLRIAAVRALPRIAAKDVTERLLVSALGDPEEAVRLEAVSSLGQSKPSAAAAAPLLEVLGNDRSSRVREAACYAVPSFWDQLSDAQKDATARFLGSLVREQSTETLREAALWSITQVRASVAADEVLAIARSPSEPYQLRRVAVQALGGLDAPHVTDVLIQIASEPKASKVTDVRSQLALRVAAIAALGERADTEAVDELWDLSADPNADIAAAATRALQRPMAYSEEAAKVLAEDEAPTPRRVFAASVIGGSRDRRAVQPLLTALADVNVQVREAAVVSLGNFTDSTTLRAVQSRLSRDEPVTTRVAAAQVLGRVRTDEAQALLGRSANDPAETVRVAVAQGLGTPETSQGQAPLLRLANDASPQVRAAAASSLGRLRGGRITQELQRLSSDADAGVRAAAVEALRQAVAPERPSASR